MIEKIKRGWAIFQEAAYHRSQEVHISVKEFKLSKRTIDVGRAALWMDGSIAPMIRWMFIVPISMLVYEVIVSETFIKIFADGAVIEALTSQGAQMLCAFIVMIFMHTKVIGWNIRSNMVKFMNEIQNYEQIRSLLMEYKWFYLIQDDNCEPVEIVFTKMRPMYLLRASTRFKTNYPWGKPLRRNFFTWFIERIIGGFYLRILWPYLFNPMQLAFLEYDKAAKRVGLKSGQRVLVIGAGSVPHHIRWKKRLGPDGTITALDVDPFVLKDSKRIECVIEWARGIFSKRRLVSAHIPGDAVELPFGTATFDAVIAVRCYFVSVAEALRVLKPNGKLLISTCGDITELPKREDPRLEDTSNGWVITNTPVRDAVF